MENQSNTIRIRVMCKKCHTAVKNKEYETGLESHCECQCTLDARFNSEHWYIEDGE